MAISFSKGGNASSSREDPNLRKVLVGLGRDARATDGADYDLEASVFTVDEKMVARTHGANVG